ncbi:MAG: class I SAM-dependent methyltransferase [Desulfuromonadaceae bacterium]
MNVAFIHGDVLELPLARDHYSQIVCYSVFPHFGDKLRALIILNGLLKPGGRLTIAHSQSRHAINNLHRKADAAVSEDHLPTLEELVNMYTAVGLEPVAGIDSASMFVISGIKPADDEKSPP